MNPAGVAELLAEHPLFRGLAPGDLAQVAGCSRNVRFTTGETILAEGQPANYFYLLRHGRVTLETAAPGRGAIVIETLSPGDVLGWSWLLPPYRSHFDARAVEPTVALRFDGACLRTKLAADPRLGYELLSRFAELIVDRLQATRVRLLDLYGDGHDRA